MKKLIKWGFLVIAVVLIASLSFAMTDEETAELSFTQKVFRRTVTSLNNHRFNKVDKELSRNIDVNHINKGGKTLLIAVCGKSSDNIEAVTYLVEAGIDIEVELRGKTAIMFAIRGGHEKIIKYLLDNDARVDGYTQKCYVNKIKDPELREILIDEGCEVFIDDDD